MTAEARSREVRFGLVMYGGVSLAIYINGVSHEFCRAVRGEGVYKLLKILTDSEIVVDIVSGSSAGGINGIFLGFALANAKDFGGMAQLWRQRGDIERLLRPFDADPETCQSLLDSEGYYEPELGKALKGLPSYPTGDYDPRTNEIDLFITGTHVDGEVYTVVDDDGHSIDVKDHRTVFWLKHRAGRKEQLHDDDTTRAALARLARLTSCFPAAFAPVRVEAGPRGSGDGGDSRDALLRQWGDFTNERYFLDGGVLNNKPFSHTIKAIFRRTQVRPVDRYLAYVEPDPDFFPDQRVEAPTFVEATIEGAFGIKGYESIADDLQLIHRHNSAVDRYWHVCRDLRGKLPETDPAWWQTGEGTRWGVVLPSNAHIKSDGFSVAQRTTYARSRFSALAMRSLSGILTKDGDREKIAPEDHLDVTKLVRSLSDMILDEDEPLCRFDVYFRLRRLYHLTYRIADEMRRSDGAASSAWAALWERMNLHTEIADIIRHAMEYVLDHAKIAWKGRGHEEVWNDVRWRLERLLAARDGQGELSRLPNDASELKAFHARLMARAQTLLGGVEVPRDLLSDPAARFEGLLGYTDERVFAELDQPAFQGLAFTPEAGGARCPVREELAEYVLLDAIVYPLEFVSDQESKDRIKILRISPRDGQLGFSRRNIEDKLAGDALAHFGGFFKRSWRSNDILWGRLDTVGQLLHALITPERLKEVTTNLGAKVKESIPDRAALVGLIGDRCPAAVDLIHDWVQRLSGADSSARDQAVQNEDEIAAMIERLTEIAQLEILHECVPAVIEDAVTQQTEWNQYAGPARPASFKDDAALLAEALAVEIVDDDPSDLARCRLLMREVGGDRTLTEALWMELNSDAPARQSWWRACVPGSRTVTNGARMLDDAAVPGAGSPGQRPPLSRRDRRRLLTQAAMISVVDEERTALERCRLFADHRQRDPARVDEMVQLLWAHQRGKPAWWDALDRPGAPHTRGQRIVVEAITASYRRPIPDGGELYRFRATEGFVDATVASRAAAHFASASLADLQGPPGALAPRHTKMGRFFLEEYRVGSEDVWGGIPWLVMLQLLSRAALVLRSCVLGALPRQQRDRIAGHVLFRFGFEWPLKIVHALALYERQRPGSASAVRTGLVGAALASLIAVAFFKGSFLIEGCSLVLWRCAVFVGIPAVVLFARIRRLMIASWLRAILEAAGAVGVAVGAFYGVGAVADRLGRAWTLGLAAALLLAFLAGARSRSRAR